MVTENMDPKKVSFWTEQKVTWDAHCIRVAYFCFKTQIGAA